jgi:pyruvate dehydrogenase E2 component (dihydrolipoamide acetyltransferase)
MQEIRLPQLGQSVEEASIVEWFKKEGDSVEKGEPLFSVQTDKAEIEVEAEASGTLRKILVQPDVFIPVLTVVALAGDADEPLPDLAQYQIGQPAPAAETPTAAPAPPSAQSVAAPASATTAASPRARKAASELGVDTAQLQGSGPGGRVLESDVQAHAEAAAGVRATPTARRVAANEGIDLQHVAGTGPRGKVTKEDVLHATKGATAPAGAVQRVPLSPMRRIIAERMVASKFSAPHYYVTVEVDMTAAVAHRKSVAFKPSFNDMLMLAVARGIREFPLVNARWAGDAIEQVSEVNLGLAVALPTGLVVPVVRGVQDLSLEGIANQARILIEKARIGKLLPDDFAGSTFTISNLGGFGVDQFTAIINQPNSAILAAGQIKDRPVVIDGGIHVRPIMKLTLSSDHRVIDGAVAAQFMGRMKAVLENGEF